MTTAATHDEWTEGHVSVDGVDLHYDRTGRRGGAALVLAHGLSDNGRCWQRVAAALGAHFDIVMLDARNHGRSDTAPTSPQLLADDVAAAITSLQLDRPAVMGHSIGAHTMALLAVRNPELVSRLVLEDPPWSADREHAGNADDAVERRRADIIAWLGSFADMTDADIASLGRTQHADWSEDDYPAWIESNRQVRVDAVGGLDFGGWADVASAIGCPTLLVFGDAERGGLVTPTVARRVVERNSNITSAFVDGAGHNIRRENFRRYIDVVSGFLVDETIHTSPVDSQS